ncbi:MAG: hypothetical protein ACQET1_02260 [Gemmatimonadota bacterium]
MKISPVARGPDPCLACRVQCYFQLVVLVAPGIDFMKLTGKRTTLAILVLSALLAPGAADGQSIPSPYRFLETRQEVDVFLGTMSPGTGRFDLGPQPGTALGARYGINVAGPFGLEGVVTYLPTERSIIDPGRAEGDFKVGEMPSDVVMLDARLRFALTGNRTWHGLAPFVLAGGGVAFDAAGGDEDQEILLADDRFKFGTSFVGMLGGGARWFPGERFFFRADALLFLWQLKTPRGFTDPERAFEGVEEKEWVSGPSFSVGFGIRF